MKKSSRSLCRGFFLPTGVTGTNVGVDIGGDSRPQEVTVDVGPSFRCTKVVLVIVISCEQGFPDWFVQGDTEPFIMVNQSVVNIVCWEAFGIGDNWGEEFVTNGRQGAVPHRSGERG